jgi:hypothetical protein
MISRPLLVFALAIISVSFAACGSNGRTEIAQSLPPKAAGPCPSEAGTVVVLGGPSESALRGNGNPVRITVTVGERFWVDAYQGKKSSNFPVASNVTIVQPICNLIYYDKAQDQHSVSLFRAATAGTVSISSSNTCDACAELTVSTEVTVKS